LVGDYQVPGWTELDQNENPYSLTKKEKEEKMKKEASSTAKSTLSKNGAAAMGIKEGAPSHKGGLKEMPQH